MRVVGNSEDGKYFWLRCESCHMTYLYSGDSDVSDRAVDEPQILDLLPKTETPSKDVREYSVYKTFALGQKIYHKKFDDVGEVISKSKIDRGSKITVSFDKCGEKILVEGIAQTQC
ncbi:hypothetical protein JXJ21_23335 [candidate division KSB1 bacterium]|nr:hypothetical protein [candidate division KSB1 bacterium]